jgi:hypothetical protein
LTARPAPITISPTCMHGPRSICPGAGWIGLDPDIGAADRREPHSAGRHAALPQCRADFGLASYAEVDFAFDMRVDRVAEHPRITKPFNEESGLRLMRSARISTPLKAGDVRLTMGGEPTFVSIDDFESEEWNTAAVGPQKREAGRQADPPAARPLRAGRLPALRPGQMVSRRDPAALDLLALLAARRQADLGNPELIAEEGKDTGQATPRPPGSSRRDCRQSRALKTITWFPPMRIRRNGSSRKATFPTM